MGVPKDTPTIGEKMNQTKHPRALYMLFIVEMWERFSYYGMRALLIFYITKHFLFSDEKAYTLYGAYTALVYTTPLLGGIIADRLLGYRKAVTLGAIFMMLGHFAMAFNTLSIFYLALGLLIVGNGFFKPNISTIVGALYPEGDPRRDGGFTIFYMGINLGALLSPILCGAIGEIYGWHYGFSIAGIGMFFGLIVFLYGQRMLGDIAKPPQPEKLREHHLGINKEVWVYIGAAALVIGATLLVQFGSYVGDLLTIVGIISLSYIIYYMVKHCNTVEWQRLTVLLVFTVFSMIFWAFFEQAGSSMNLFTDRNVDRELIITWLPTFILHLFPSSVIQGSHFVWTVPASLFQSVNPVFILIVAPLLSKLWIFLGARKKDLSVTLKFSLALIQLGVGFFVLYYGAMSSNAQGLSTVWWLLLGILLHTTGELCTSPIGLSAVTKLSPARIGALMMGIWMLSMAFAQYIAGFIAKLTSQSAETGELTANMSALDAAHVYGNVFNDLGYIAIGVGIVLALFYKVLNRYSHNA